MTSETDYPGFGCLFSPMLQESYSPKGPRVPRSIQSTSDYYKNQDPTLMRMTSQGKTSEFSALGCPDPGFGHISGSTRDVAEPVAESGPLLIPRQCSHAWDEAEARARARAYSVLHQGSYPVQDGVGLITPPWVHPIPGTLDDLPAPPRVHPPVCHSCCSGRYST